MALDEQWRKTKRSGGSSGNCVEARHNGPTVEVRDSKDPNGPTLSFAPAAWREFLASLGR
jgi:hypothetical protein